MSNVGNEEDLKAKTCHFAAGIIAALVRNDLESLQEIGKAISREYMLNDLGQNEENDAFQAGRLYTLMEIVSAYSSRNIRQRIEKKNKAKVAVFGLLAQLPEKKPLKIIEPKFYSWMYDLYKRYPELFEGLAFNHDGSRSDCLHQVLFHLAHFGYITISSGEWVIDGVKGSLSLDYFKSELSIIEEEGKKLASDIEAGLLS